MEEKEYGSRFPKLKLPFLSMDTSPEHPSGTRTPPLQTLASVPFKWEEQPGKPRTCTDIIISLPEFRDHHRELQLPPCRQMSMDRIPKTPSPTTVLDGPYVVGRPKFSSFRLFREPQIDSFSSCSSSVSPESADVDRAVLGKIVKEGINGKARSGFFGSLRFSSPSVTNTIVCDGEESCAWTDVRRKGSFSHATSPRTHLWGAIYKGLKHVLPWKSSKKFKKEVQI